jgi:hypothetical protein
MQANTTSEPQVIFYRAMYGLPAEVMVREDGAVRVRTFNVGHVFTDNAAAKEYAAIMAANLGCSVERGEV